MVVSKTLLQASLIKSKLKFFLDEWLSFVRVPSNLLNVIFSITLLFLSYKITIFAGLLATKNAGLEPINDLILSNIPRIDTSFIHGTVSFFIYDMRWLLFLIFIQCAPFATKALASVVLLRAVTINLTNLGMPADIVPTFAEATFGGDLFFSGHVANTFMLALCFWHIKILRYFAIGITLLFGGASILGHYHYTIDVLAAPFFAYGVFVFSQKIFKNDYQQMVKFQKKLNGEMVQ